MPNNIKALLVIVALLVISYGLLAAFSRKIGYSSDLKFLYKWCLVTTALAFLAGNYWLFIVATAFILISVSKHQNVDYRIAMYFFLLLSLPSLVLTIPGFLGIRNLFEMSWPKLLSFTLLVPLIPYVNRSATGHKVHSIGSDKLVLVFFAYLSILSFRDTTVTNAFRSIFEIFTIIVLPYFVVSRGIRSESELLRVVHAIYAIVFFMVIIGIFSAINHWHLYYSLGKALGVNISIDYYNRMGFLRAAAVYGNIHLGTLIGVLIGLGILLYQRGISPGFTFLLTSILVIGMLLTFSRGPWIATLVMLLVYSSLSKNKSKTFFRIFFVSSVFLVFASTTEFGAEIIDLLPFIGTADTHTVDYRQTLFDVAVAEINEHPLFGSTDYLQSPRMQELIQGQGIIDLVNTYIQIGLEYGYTGILLFVAIMVGIPLQMYRLRKELRGNVLDSLLNQGAVLIAVGSLILVVIGTVSSLGNDQITAFIWGMAGLNAAYLRICRTILTNKAD